MSVYLQYISEVFVDVCLCAHISVYFSEGCVCLSGNVEWQRGQARACLVACVNSSWVRNSIRLCVLRRGANVGTDSSANKSLSLQLNTREGKGEIETDCGRERFRENTKKLVLFSLQQYLYS